MRKKLEKMLNEEHVVKICMDCNAIKIDNESWLTAHKAKEHKVHNHYKEVHIRNTKTHGLCYYCYDVRIKEMEKGGYFPWDKKYG